MSQAQQFTAAGNEPAVPAIKPFASGRHRLGAVSPIPQAPDAVPLDSLTEADLKARDLLEVHSALSNDLLQDWLWGELLTACKVVLVLFSDMSQTWQQN